MFDFSVAAGFHKNLLLLNFAEQPLTFQASLLLLPPGFEAAVHIHLCHPSQKYGLA